MPGDKAPPKAPGLIEQARATVAAGRRLVESHVALTKADLGAIVADAKVVATLGGIALALVLFVALFVPIGLTLFFGEWLFGSMGWGILHGTELSLAVAVILVLVALRVPRGSLVRTFLVAVLVGVLVAIAFGTAWANLAWTRLGDALLPGVDAGVRPLITALAGGAVVVGVLGLVAGWRSGLTGRQGSASIVGLIAGLVAGAGLGALTAISYSTRVGVAIGIALGLALWPILSATALRGFDWAALQARFTPTATIDTTQETIEWLQQTLARMRPAKRP